MMNKLLPCPFCGGKAYIDKATDDYPNYTIHCAECRTSTAWYADKQSLADAWNCRVKPCDIAEYAEDCSECGFCEKTENKPLTLDELREMDGEPVWMSGKKEWAFVSAVKGEPYKQLWLFNRKGFAETVLFHHEKFYRSKPKEVQG